MNADRIGMRNRTTSWTTSCRRKNEQVSTALLLAAGIGSRLSPFTDMAPKCLLPSMKYLFWRGSFTPSRYTDSSVWLWWLDTRPTVSASFLEIGLVEWIYATLLVTYTRRLTISIHYGLQDT